MLKILSLDTATEMCSVALLQGNERLIRQQLAPQQHAELLLPMVDQLLAEASLSLNDLDAIAFGQGPGSFMGLRVGIGVVQALAYAADKPVIAISSLQVLAQTAYEQQAVKRALCAFDARMQALYWGSYELDNQQLMQSLEPDALSKPADLHFNTSAEFTPVGHAWRLYAPALNLDFKIEEPIELYPLASALLSLAAAQYQLKQFQSAFEAQPHYLRDQVGHKGV